MINIKMLLLISVIVIEQANSYIVNRCRVFPDSQLVSNFSFEKFSGDWFPYYQSKLSNYLTGKCPILNIGPRQSTDQYQESQMKQLSEEWDQFQLKYSYKGMAMIVDNIRTYYGKFVKGMARGSIWVGPVLSPLESYNDNFQVLSTDYETYAITYQCTSKTVLFNQDHIKILTRESPGFGKIDPATDQLIRSEFKKIFGSIEPVSLQTGKSPSELEDNQNKTMTEINNNTGQVTKRGQGLKSQVVDVLEFDKHLTKMNHRDCTPDHYPNLAVSLIARNQMIEENKRRNNN